jgi:hypothetical protein
MSESERETKKWKTLAGDGKSVFMYVGTTCRSKTVSCWGKLDGACNFDSNSASPTHDRKQLLDQILVALLVKLR